jgi:hypothetical protein
MFQEEVRRADGLATASSRPSPQIGLHWTDAFAAATARGFRLEIPLGGSHAAITLSTNERHPQLGNGLLGKLKLPLFDLDNNVAERCAARNLEDTMWTDIPQFGCWHPFYFPDDHAAPQFSSFIPNALYGNGIASLMVLWPYQKYRLVVHREYPN